MKRDNDLDRRADALYRERYVANARRVDRMFAVLMVAQWIFAIVLAVTVSPYTWVGKTSSLHVHVYVAVFLGGAISSLPICLALLRPGWVVTHYVIAVGQMMWSALLIHLSGGKIETHFHVFGSLAFLAFYRDWKLLIPATIVVASDHLIRQFVWPESVYGVANPEWWRFLEHAGWVLFEDVFLVLACLRGSQEMRAMSRQQVAIELHERQAAARMQTAILPREIVVDGLEAAAAMRTADQVGGDYYDVLPVDGGCWIAIGDVTGHGVAAGLTMLQAQAALGALVRHAPHAAPLELWGGLNRTFVDHVRNRMGQEDHMTLSLMRFQSDGQLRIVGAHEEIVVWREAKQSCEVIPISGTWIGLTTAAPHMVEQSVQLACGDVVVLYTDGIIEAAASGDKRVGVEGVIETVARVHARPAGEIRDAIFELAGADRKDDATVVVFRYKGEMDRAAATAA